MQYRLSCCKSVTYIRNRLVRFEKLCAIYSISSITISLRIKYPNYSDFYNTS